MKKPLAPPSKPILEAALALLTRREHSQSELVRKLRQKGYTTPDIASIIPQLQNYNYLNNARAAGATVRHRAHTSKWGPARIKQELSAKGLKAEQEQAFSTLADHNWRETAITLLHRKFPTPLPAYGQPAYEKERARRLNFLLRRGFSMSDAMAALQLSGVEDSPEMP